MRYVYLLLLLLLGVTAVRAQEAEKQRIREIKLDSTYVGKEATNESRDSAYIEACQLLAMTINTHQWGHVSHEQLKPIVEQIHVMRGDYHRVFVYLKKTDIPGATPSSRDMTQPTETVVNQPEETVTQQPVGTQPAQPAVTSTDQPAESQPTESSVTQQRVNLTKLSAYNEVLMSLLPREMFNEVKKCLEAYVKMGKLEASGLFNAKANEPYDACYFVIVNSNMTIRAYLTPEVNGRRTNVATGREDKLSNYAGCGAMWFR